MPFGAAANSNIRIAFTVHTNCMKTGISGPTSGRIKKLKLKKKILSIIAPHKYEKYEIRV